MRSIRRVFNKEHFRAVLITAIPFIIGGAIIFASSYSLPEKEAPTSIENAPEDVEEVILSDHSIETMFSDTSL